MEKLYICYLMNNLIDDINDTKNNINLSLCNNLKKNKTKS